MKCLIILFIFSGNFIHSQTIKNDAIYILIEDNYERSGTFRYYNATTSNGNTFYFSWPAYPNFAAWEIQKTNDSTIAKRWTKLGGRTNELTFYCYRGRIKLTEVQYQEFFNNHHNIIYSSDFIYFEEYSKLNRAVSTNPTYIICREEDGEHYIYDVTNKKYFKN